MNQMDKDLIGKYGQLVGGKRGRWITLLVWLILLAVLNMTLPQASTQKNDTARNLSSELPSQKAKEISGKYFSNGTGTPALLTWYRTGGLTNDDLLQIQKLTQDLEQNPAINQSSVVPLHRMPLPALQAQISKDGTTLIVPVTFKKGASSVEMEDGINDISEKIDKIFQNNPLKAKIDSKELVVRTTGPAGIAVDATKLFSQGDLTLLFGTVAIVLILLLLIYRSPILAIIPLIGVGIAYGVISPILGWIGESGLAEFDSQSLSIMTVLLFGAGTDYCLFLISSYRRQLEEVDDKFLAMRLAITNSSGAIAMSGLTVVFSLLALLLTKYGAINRFGIPFSLSILIMMLASLTLVPALLSILGRASFFPFIPNPAKPKKISKIKIGASVGNIIVKKPWTVTLITTVFLFAFALFSLKIQYTFDTLSSFPKDLPSREGFKLISDHYSPGELAPVEVIVKNNQTNSSVKKELETLSYVANVTEGVPSENDKNFVKYNVKFNINPYSNEAMDKIPDIEAKVINSLKKEGVNNPSQNVWISGMTAEQHDTKVVTDKDRNIVIPTIIVMIAALLLVYLRSITATIYLIATVLLSYFSALGLGWVILHYFFGVDAIQGFIPLYAFVFIVALGEDYNIFMISSIWKKSKVMPLNQAIKEGVSESGAVITSAGLILAATFMILTTMPIQVLVHFGFITAIGVLLDTFVVRPFLVPAITVLLGKWAFWPSKVKRYSSQEN
jgi:RND superfamily putative drug exporter